MDEWDKKVQKTYQVIQTKREDFAKLSQQDKVVKNLDPFEKKIFAIDQRQNDMLAQVMKITTDETIPKPKRIEAVKILDKTLVKIMMYFDPEVINQLTSQVIMDKMRAKVTEKLKQENQN